MTNKKAKKIIEEYENSFTERDWDRLSSKLAVQKTRYQANTKKVRINLRIGEGDLQKVKEKAKNGGIKSQTLLSVLINKYANDKLKIEL